MLGSQLLLPFVNLDDPNFLGGATYCYIYKCHDGGNLKSLFLSSLSAYPLGCLP